MADLLFVAIVITFFALLVLLVKACDRIIGSDLVLVEGDNRGSDVEEELAA